MTPWLFVAGRLQTNSLGLRAQKECDIVESVSNACAAKSART